MGETHRADDARERTAGRPSGRQRSITALLALLLVATAACGGGGGDDDAGSSSSTTAETDEREDDERDDAPERGDGPSDAPAMLVSHGPHLGYAAPAAPAAAMSDPTAAPRVIDRDGPETETDEVSISPDGRLVAMSYPVDAVTKARIDFVSTLTGEVVDTTTSSGTSAERIAEVMWSPDSRAFAFNFGNGTVLHRVGGQTVASGKVTEFTFASNEDTTDLISCAFSSIMLLRVTDGDGDGTRKSDAVRGCKTAQAFDAEREPVVVSNTFADTHRGEAAVALHRAGDDPSGLEIPSDIPREDSYGMMGCGSVVRLWTQNSAFLYSTISGAFVGTSNAEHECPVVSPDGSKAAFVSHQRIAQVADFATRTVTDVANAARPVAFGADATKLLVDGSGTFIVPTDGSQGKAASVTAVATGTGGSPSYCRLGDTGAVLLRTKERVVVFDIDRDASYDTVATGMGKVCSVFDGGRWAAAGTLLVDLEDEESWNLPLVSYPEGERLTGSSGLSTGLGHYSWIGKQRIFNTAVAQD